MFMINRCALPPKYPQPQTLILVCVRFVRFNFAWRFQAVSSGFKHQHNRPFARKNAVCLSLVAFPGVFGSVLVGGCLLMGGSSSAMERLSPNDASEIDFAANANELIADGHIHLNRGDVAHSIDLFMAVVGHISEPMQGDQQTWFKTKALVGLAQAFRTVGQYERSIRCLEKVLLCAPRQPLRQGYLSALVSLGDIYSCVRAAGFKPTTLARNC